MRELVSCWSSDRGGMQGMSPCLEFCESNGHCLAVFEGIRPGPGPLNGNSTVTVCSVHASKIGRFKLCQRFHQENSVIRSNQKHPWPSGNLCIVLRTECTAYCLCNKFPVCFLALAVQEVGRAANAFRYSLHAVEMGLCFAVWAYRDRLSCAADWRFACCNDMSD